jgi:non-heme chloroperoxidase
MRRIVATENDAYFARDLPGNAVSQETISWTMRDMQRASFQAIFECNRSMVEADWRQEMRAITVPVLLVHGDRDASMPIDLSSRRTLDLVPNGRLEVYENAGHGLYVTHKVD